MSPALLLLFLHISLMFVAVTLAFGPSIVLRLAYRTGEVANVRAAAHLAHRLGPAAPLAFTAGGLFGLFTAIAFGFNLLAPWLVIAYVLFALMIVTGTAIARPWTARLRALLDRTPDGPVTPPLRNVFTERLPRLSNLLDYLVLAALIFDMVVKPAPW